MDTPETSRVTLVELQDCEHVSWVPGHLEAGASIQCAQCGDRVVVRAFATEVVENLRLA